MSDRIARIVLLPRYTALYGTAPIYGAPVNVRRFAGAVLVGWRSQGLGTAGSQASVEYGLQQSTDLGIWNDIEPTLSPAAEDETPASVTFDLEWIRLVSTVSGTKPGLTGWVVGHFVPREGLVSFAQ